MKAFFKKLAEFLRNGVWKKENDEFNSRKSLWFTRQLRLLIYTVKGVGRHSTFIRASALTFYTLMSMVPILALAFSIVKGLGMDDRLELFLTDRFPALNELTHLASSIIERTRGGIVAIMGVVILIWAAVRVFSNTEDAFNNIWEIRKKRSIGRKISAYAVVILIIPIVWILISAVIAYMQNIISNYKFLPGRIFYLIGSALFVWLLFTAMYKIIPNTGVKLRIAARAAIFATVGFLLFQIIYVYTRNSVNAYNVIYGSFAAIPLFLIWLQTSWIIILHGAELSFSYQNMESYRQEMDSLNVSYDNRRKIMVAAMLVIARNFVEETGMPSSEEIAKRLRLPLRIVREVVGSLESAGLIAAVQDSGNDKTRRFLPAHEVSRMTFYGVLEKVEGMGENIIGASSDRPELDIVNEMLEDMKAKASLSKANMPLLTMLKDEGSNIG